MAFQPTPITLITGYLGSGKTTLINHILRNAKGHKMAVIVNDLGEVNIDAELIASEGIVSAKYDNLVALQNGCICCTLKADLINQLADLVNSKQFDHILIEASGICEPVPIAQSICYMENEFKRQNLRKFYYLDAVISVTDALRLRDEFGCGESLQMIEHEEEHEGEESIESLIIQQLEFCDIVLLNKASEVSKKELSRIETAIRAIQLSATIIPTDYAAIDIDSIIDTHLFDFEKAATSAAWIREYESWDNENEDHDDDDEHEHHEHDEHDHDDDDHDHDHEEHEHKEGHHHHHHHHHHEHGLDQNDDEGTAEEYGVQTYVYYRRTPFDREKFIEWAQNNAHKIIRSKGMLYFKDDVGNCCIYETAGRQIKLSLHGQWFSTSHTVEECKAAAKDNPYYAHDYDEVYQDRLVKLVFIGQNLDKKAIRKELDQI